MGGDRNIPKVKWL